MKRIRVISDLHLDVNRKHCFKLTGNDDFTVIAGDTSGDPRITSEWVKKNIKHGVLVSGNHLVYNKRGLSVQALRDELHNEFPASADVTYLETMCGVSSKEVDGILFVGSCLYTDMKLPSWKNPNGIEEINCRVAQQYLNDFHWGMVEAEDTSLAESDGLRRVRGKDYMTWFEKSFAKMSEIIEANEAQESPRPVVVVTHHAPSKMCVGSMYVDDDANCAYVSELDDFIKRHKSIRCWVYGHIHEHKEAKIVRDDGTSCILVNNSRGYCSRLEDRDFNPNTFINTETWEIETTPLSKSAQAKMKARQEEYNKKLTEMLAWGFF